ncbi:MAG: M23 family metallopeptidase, partial [Candidatus Aenigmatarchaeota archaeon]
NYATENKHYLSLHEYGYKSMNGNFGEWVGRYKKVYEKYGFNLPLLITETGIDEAGDPEMSGWRAHTNAEEYMNQLKWYDEIIKQDDYVIGATIFHYGLYDWNSFEIYPDLTGNDGTNGPLVKYLKQSIENNNKKTIKYIISESNIIEILPNQCPAILIKKPFTTTTITKTLSFSWPLENYKIYSLTSCFGWRKLDGSDNFHTGIDIGTPEGTEIKAAFDGKVLKIRNGDGSDLLTGYGNYVILEHDLDGKKYYSFYGHLKCSGVIVKEGDTVKTGDIIGYSGGVDKCKGTSTGAHLHFEIREGENNIRGSVNPCLFLDDCGCKKECENYNQKYDEYKCPKS